MHSSKGAKKTGRISRFVVGAFLCIAALTPSLAQVSRYDEKQCLA